MPAPGEFLNPNSWASNAPGQAAWFGLQMLAPNIASLLTGQPPPALPNVPEMPGKVPSTDDPRIAGAVGEAANIGLNFLPLPGAGLAVDAGRGILGLIRRAAPEGAGLAVDAGRGILGRLSGPESLASKSARLYDPPAKSPRPFEADYPSGAPADATGRLTADIEGRPLVAERVVGRRTLGGADEALTPAELDAVAQALVGKYPESVAASALPRATVGAYVRAQGPHGIDRSILVRRDLPADVKDKVAAHELSHAIVQFAGDIVGPGQVEPTRMIPRKPGMPSELKTVYNDLNNSYLAAARKQNSDVDPEKVYWGTGVTPEKTFGYAKADAPAEYMAEAIRAYLADPNYIKTVAPKTAAAIREAVNSNPRLSKILQFNTIAGLAAMNGLDPDSLPIPRQQPPVFRQ